MNYLKGAKAGECHGRCPFDFLTLVQALHTQDGLHNLPGWLRDRLPDGVWNHRGKAAHARAGLGMTGWEVVGDLVPQVRLRQTDSCVHLFAVHTSSDRSSLFRAGLGRIVWGNPL